MKKCSTAALLLAVAASAPAFAQAGCEFAPDAPDTHLVQRGDTLWELASIFLKNPWCWTQVWERNRDQIANPHRIYPGQTIVFDRRAGRLRAVDTIDAIDATDANSAATTAAPAQKRVPLARSTPLPESRPIPALAPRLSESAMRFSLTTAMAAAAAPRIIGFTDGRRMGSSGDVAFVGGTLPFDTAFDIVRVLSPTRDPDSGEPLALTLLRVGKARYLRQDDTGLHRIQVQQASAEVMAGDLLIRARAIPDVLPGLQALVACEGKIAAVLPERDQASASDVVMINRGTSAGLVNGSLIAVMKHVKIGAHDARHHSRPAPHQVASLLVFDATEQAALALVLRSNDALRAGDAIGPLPVSE